MNIRFSILLFPKFIRLDQPLLQG